VKSFSSVSVVLVHNFQITYLLWVQYFIVTLNIHVLCRRIVYNDLQAIAPEQYFKQITKRLAEIKAVSVSSILFTK